MTEIEKEYYRRLALQEEYGGTNKPVNKITPLVSVVTITYQHAPYIRQCLDGILMQETDFPYEIIIGEDGSTDGTREICIEYANKYPDKIRLFLRDRKLTQYVTKDGRTIRFNGHFARAAARGKYVAMCEGDDYWIDKKKLSVQVAILEADKAMMLCSTSFMICNQNGTIIKKKHKNQRKIHITDILLGNPIATCTCLYRNMIRIEDVPLCLRSMWYFDCVLWILLLEKGYGTQISAFTSVYRHNETGLVRSTSIKTKVLDTDNLYNCLIDRYPDRLRKYCYRGRNASYINLAWLSIKSDPIAAKEIFRRASLPVGCNLSSYIKYFCLCIVLNFYRAN